MHKKKLPSNRDSKRQGRHCKKRRKCVDSTKNRSAPTSPTKPTNPTFQTMSHSKYSNIFCDSNGLEQVREMLTNKMRLNRMF